MNKEQIIEKLKTMVSEKRLVHSLNVRDTAVSLAEHYGADVEKASIAGVLHDCAKGYSCGESLKLCKDYKLDFDEVTLNHHALLHGPLGAKVAEVEFGVKDDDILNAIRFHTTGRDCMTLLEKIICLADYIEPRRNFKGVGEIRNIAFEDIDKALAAAFGTTIIYLVSKNYFIHPTTVLARNSLLRDIVYKE